VVNTKFLDKEAVPVYNISVSDFSMEFSCCFCLRGLPGLGYRQAEAGKRRLFKCAIQKDFPVNGVPGLQKNGRGIIVLEDLKQRRKTVGLKQTMKAVAANRVQAVFVAKDADERLVAGVMEACRDKNIQVHRAESMKLLGKACGIDVGTAVAAITIDD
jgi:large subunit ribosomal protein L7A